MNQQQQTAQEAAAFERVKQGKEHCAGCNKLLSWSEEIGTGIHRGKLYLTCADCIGYCPQIEDTRHFDELIKVMGEFETKRREFTIFFMKSVLAVTAPLKDGEKINERLALATELYENSQWLFSISGNTDISLCRRTYRDAEMLHKFTEALQVVASGVREEPEEVCIPW